MLEFFEALNISGRDQRIPTQLIKMLNVNLILIFPYIILKLFSILLLIYLVAYPITLVAPKKYLNIRRVRLRLP